MSDKTLAALKGLRGLLEDILAPTVGRLEVKVAALGERCEHLASEVKENRSAHLALLQHLPEQFSTLNSRLSKLEGRADGMKSELTAALQLEMLKIAQRFQSMQSPGRSSLPATEDETQDQT